MNPFILGNQYCIASHHNSLKNIICYEQHCPKRGLICDQCLNDEHRDHCVISLEQYINQISNVFTRTSQDKLLNNIDQFQMNVNKEIKQMVDNINVLKNQIEKYLQRLVSFQDDFTLQLDNMKEMYKRICSNSNLIRTKSDEKLTPVFVSDYVEDTLKLLEFDRTLECQIKNLDYQKQYKLEHKKIIKDSKLYQKYENVLSYTKILNKKIDKIERKLSFRVEQYFSDINTHFNFYKEKKRDYQSKLTEEYSLEPYNNKKTSMINEIKVFAKTATQSDHYQDIINLLQNKPKSIKVIQKATQQKIATIRDISSSNGSSLFATITDAGMQIWDYKSVTYLLLKI